VTGHRAASCHGQDISGKDSALGQSCTSRRSTMSAPGLIGFFTMISGSLNSLRNSEPDSASRKARSGSAHQGRFRIIRSMSSGVLRVAASNSASVSGSTRGGSGQATCLRPGKRGLGHEPVVGLSLRDLHDSPTRRGAGGGAAGRAGRARAFNRGVAPRVTASSSASIRSSRQPHAPPGESHQSRSLLSRMGRPVSFR
jgi:hypothetical protein